eukprot:SAG31_NODE_1143_length_9694_cov_5.541011_3_plen_229_part_00
MVKTIMEGSVRALVEMGWEGLKLGAALAIHTIPLCIVRLMCVDVMDSDSCSQFNNLSWWNHLINKTSKLPVLQENCHQGGFVPGMTQWQAYLRNATTGVYTHKLGYFATGHDAVQPIGNVSFASCKAECDRLACAGFCFQSDDPEPVSLPRCYVKNSSSHFSPADLSSSNHCTGRKLPSECPYNIYRTSGDIGTYWDRILSNLGSTVPFLGSSTKPPLSRPGAWAYPE